MKDRDTNHRIIPCDPYHVVSERWVAHGEIDLLIVHPGSLQIGNRRLLFVEIDFCSTNQIVVVFPSVILRNEEELVRESVLSVQLQIGSGK